MALDEHWPLFGLRISTPRLELRCPTDDDLDELLEVAAAGIHDPATMPFAIPWTDVESPERERQSLQYWWRARATCSPESWDLPFAVSLDGRLVGVQNLAATDFPVLRVAETGSWLGLAYQGQGIGKEMRAAVLHLAFEELDAYAITSAAFTDNAASQRVSIATGYEANGTSFSVRRGERAEQLRYQLTRQRWEAARLPLDVSVAGFEPCRSMLGLN